MTITTFPLTKAGQDAADAVAGPKNVAYTHLGFVVRTGPHYVEPRAPTPDEQDAEAARDHVKLRALTSMTPTQVEAWVAANVTTLAQAKDAIATLAVAVGVLARRL